MASFYGQNIKISIFGQSHSDAIGVVVDGLPAGFKIDFDQLRAFMLRRAPGRNEYSTKRREEDALEFLSGLDNGVACGAPLCAVIRNSDTRSADYDKLRNIPRPGHADYTAHIKYGGHNDIRGGGHFSGRLTAPLCVAGGICLQMLARQGIEIAAHIQSIADIEDVAFDPVIISAKDLQAAKTAEFPVISTESGMKMRQAIENARRDGDSLGGVIECAAIGLPAGLGEPMFDGVENRVAKIVFGIPAVKGIEFGNGFISARLRGSENNDAFYVEDGAVKTRTNNHGGVLGGITSGMPVIFRAAIKPTPSIALEQESVNLPEMADAKLKISGRHDPCIVPRAVPCIEAAAAIAIADMMIREL